MTTEEILNVRTVSFTKHQQRIYQLWKSGARPQWDWIMPALRECAINREALKAVEAELEMLQRKPRFA